MSLYIAKIVIVRIHYLWFKFPLYVCFCFSQLLYKIYFSFIVFFFNLNGDSLQTLLVYYYYFIIGRDLL
ncbi:hypothetical protein RJT34_29804 [Clitoria ternatea]|uniref:Uncharacterized protein n=1 Tax=Clitoria ternatea TaxID=43366 RepID=A0AAN9I6Q9_CLITE